MSEETVKVDVELPHGLYSALQWYVRLTSFWVCNDYEKKAIQAFMIYAIESFMESEAECPQLARGHIKHILKNEHGL